MSKKQLSVLLPVVAFLSGVIDVALRFSVLGNFHQAAFSVLHDPSKVTMHLVLLPLALFVLIDRFPTDLVHQLIDTDDPRVGALTRLFAVVWGICLIGLLTTVMIHDPQDGFCERPPAPEDVKHETIRTSMAKERLSWQEKLQTRQAILGQKSPEYEQYQVLVAQARGDNCSVWRLTTPRGLWAIFLTFQALAVIAVFFWLLGCYGIRGQRPPPEVTEGFILFVVFMAPWVALRPLSEWLANFGHYDYGSYRIWFFAAFLLVIVAGILTMMVSGKGVAKGLAAVAGIGSTVLGAIAAFLPDEFTPLAKGFGTQDRYLIFFEYVFFVAFVIFAVQFFRDPTDRPTPQRAEPPGIY